MSYSFEFEGAGIGPYTMSKINNYKSIRILSIEPWAQVVATVFGKSAEVYNITIEIEGYEKEIEDLARDLGAVSYGNTYTVKL